MFNIDLNKLAEIFLYNPQNVMTFNTSFFLFWLTGVLLIFSFLRKKDMAKIVFLLLCSYYFYYKTNGFYFLLIWVVTFCDFVLAYFMGKVYAKNNRRILLTISIVIDLGLLAYFKYTNFLFSSFSELFGQPFSPFDIILPVGISFFTFQSISYVVDVYRGAIRPLNSLLDYAFYVSFFPQLVAGPIVRAKDFIPQIHTTKILSDRDLAKAFSLILFGLFKKCVVSDYISINFVDRVFDAPALYSGIENLFAVYGYAIQIYCDFSGYSDMAIGIALLFGYRLGLNFNMPYKSATITEFWHRWHISLSSWLKDYLYISLGGNRKGKKRMYLNLMITMLLGGLWHGASLRFILWGGLHGLYLVIHKYLISVFPSWKVSGSQMSVLGRIGGTFVTFHLVCFGWIFFRADNMEVVGSMLMQIFTAFRWEVFVPFIEGYAIIILLIVSCFIAQFTPIRYMAKIRSGIRLTSWEIKAILLTLLIILIAQIKSAELQPFIYFQF